MSPRAAAAEAPPLEFRRVPVEKLKPDPDNARKHGDRNLAAIRASLERFGQRRPLVVTKGLVVVAGNGTLEAAKALGWTHVDVTVLPWSDRKRSRAFALADNRTAELAAWDLELLGEQLQGMDDAELESAGWLRQELDTMQGGGARPRKATEPKVGARIPRGALKLVHGDSLEVLAGMEENSVDAIVTDPPYGLEFMGKDWDRFRVDPRAARWSGKKSGGAGAGISEFHLGGKGGKTKLPSFGRRRSTWRCETCGRRDAFRNDHECGEAADWRKIPVDGVPIEARAFGNWCETWAAHAIRILKPGGHLLAFGGTRTYHRLTVALEDSGFEIRDTVMWLYGSGFPKSLDVSKAIDAAAGAERAKVRTKARPESSGTMSGAVDTRPWIEESRRIGYHEHDGPEPVTPEAERWEGWGTALKPGFEPIVVARKPISEGNIAENVQRWGTGAINVDAARLGMSTHDRERFAAASAAWEASSKRWGDSKAAEVYGTYEIPPVTGAHPDGRWPGNVALDEEAAAMLDAQSGPVGDRGGGPSVHPPQAQDYADGRTVQGARGQGDQSFHYGDAGGASRFFYCPKADREEREIGAPAGAAEAGAGLLLWSSGTQTPGGFQGEGTDRRAWNHHPTVKPVRLMQWLCRLVTPRGGVILDPFTGSGTTGMAALREGFRFVGIERDKEYIAIARRRIKADPERGAE